MMWPQSVRTPSLAIASVASLLIGCTQAPPTVVPESAAQSRGADAPARQDATADPKPVLSAKEAFARGWMPLRATGVEDFLKAHPTYDGRGVLIGVLDSGIDPSIPGLLTTTSGERKILDLRDFSGEGVVPLVAVTSAGDEVTIAGRTLRGVSRVRALAAGGALYGGSIAEIPLGEMPASDLNGDRDDSDTLVVLVAHASDGWVLFADTDGDGSLANEKPVHDFLTARETFGWHTGTRAPGLALAVNLRDEKGQPRLDLYFDTSAHGSHVAGIAAGHDIYGVSGFNGVAPGAWLLGLKIANNAQGGISTTGSMLAAISYAMRFAQERRLPLVLNMSFGVGNEGEGQARIDQLIDSVLAAHPDVIFTISAGNDGPGLSTMGFPGSASRALTVGATFPSVFIGASGRGGDPVAYFSSRGGELAKPDIVTPGMAYSTVPRWNVGDERKGGTSMASPHAAGLAALLVSGLAQEKRPVDARQVRQALMVTARPMPTGSYLDDGTGQPDVGAAWRWLAAGRSAPDIAVRSVGNGVTAAFQHRIAGVTADTAQGFQLMLPEGSPEVTVKLRSSAPWLHAPSEARLRPGSTTVTLGYDPATFTRAGLHSAVVTGWTTDSLAGPAFRLVNTIAVADTGGTIGADLGRLPANTEGRLFFKALPSRPFGVAFTTRSAGEQVVAYLHEPGGQPYREENGIGAGYGEEAGLYLVDGRDVVPGFYEAVAVAPPLDSASAIIVVQQSPVTIEASRQAHAVAVTLDNVSADTVASTPFVVLVGAERTVTVAARGGEPQHVRFTLPDWAVHAAVDVNMARGQWPIFTDFGVTMLDGAGRQMGKSPLNYAFGRLHVDLPGRGAGPVEVELFPGLADSAAGQRWSVTVSVRLYADSAHVTRLPGEPVTIAPGASATVFVPMEAPVLSLGDGFVPLGIVVVPELDRTWTREAPLPSPATASTQ
ncbi:MAG: S8 family serine peptidase [Gemmatimonadota bacterium]